MKKLLSLGLVICSLFVFTSCKKSPEERAEKIVDKVSSKLDLTEAQEKKLTLIKDKYLNLRTTHKNADKRKKVEALILSKSLDDNEVKYLYEAKQKRMKLFYDELYPLIKDFHASLTDEQKEDVVKFMNKMHERFN